MIENYNHSKPFSNFLPGIAGLWGIPMWVFYVNRGQCVASFGMESKDKAIMEFQPANKAYRLTTLQGFRTFIKVKNKNKTIYWEPFQEGLKGTDFRKKQTLSMSAHDLTIEEINLDLGLAAQVNYFTLPEEPFPALVRRCSIKNLGSKIYNIEMIDGLPVIIPFGMNEWVTKHMSRTVEAWVKVRNLENKVPYYQLNVEVSDKPEVKHIKEGNFFLSFSAKKFLQPIVEAASVFGPACDFSVPTQFLEKKFSVPKIQQVSNRTPSAMAYAKFSLKGKEQKEIVSLFGHSENQERLEHIAHQITAKEFIQEKAHQNETLINGIKNFAFTQSSSKEFDLYCGHTFLDNVLRGGLPVSIKTTEGNVALNVYTRKHGDLERDYNQFVIAPTFYSQGNGNYRDVNQNRRNDNWFNTDVKADHVINFLNLIQADGYNPLIVKGTSFVVENEQALLAIVEKCVKKGDIKEFLKHPFQLGSLLAFIHRNAIELKVNEKEFVGQILHVCHRQEIADHGEGFWSDHWTYNLDLVERYLALYPEELENILLKKKVFYFYLNSHYVLPRHQRYILTEKGVRQYHSVIDATKEIHAHKKAHCLRVNQGDGPRYETTMLCKLLSLVANKIATLDPSGIGVEMEADKPNWYDALNGLPGLLGSSISETFEVKRLSLFLLKSLEQISVKDNVFVVIFLELKNFIDGLTLILESEKDAHAYWMKSNDLKENYRESVRLGIEGDEKGITIGSVKNFLKLVIERTDQSISKASNTKGFLPTYFYHEVSQYKKNEESSTSHVHPVAFKKQVLPLFLEGYVHALRTSSLSEAKKLYGQVRKSPLFDAKLKMYKVNEDLSSASEEIGRTRIFPRGWLENESIWLHMEYKFMLELLRSGLVEEFYDNFKNVMIPFLKAETYGRSILENSSFIVSSAHEDKALHGQGFVARLSGSTAEFLHIWLIMNIGEKPFQVNGQGQLELKFQPKLTGWLFSKEATALFPKNTYAFNFLGSTLVVYHNPKRSDTFGPKAVKIKEVHLTYSHPKSPIVISSEIIPTPYSQEIRDKKVNRVDVYLQ